MHINQFKILCGKVTVKNARIFCIVILTMNITRVLAQVIPKKTIFTLFATIFGMF